MMKEAMMRFSFERTVRTGASERWFAYASAEDDKPVACMDIHILPGDKVHATVVLLKDMEEKDLDRLIQDFDDDVVNMADLKAGNLFVALFKGTEVGHYQISEE
jgi:hypothetical protein